MRLKLVTLVITIIGFSLTSCGSGEKKDDKSSQSGEVTQPVSDDPMQDKGVGPVKSVTLGEIDPALVTKGEEIFKAKCTACHKIGKRYIGPNLEGVTERRTPEWIMNMILNPEKMVAENEIAKKLLAEYTAPMANQSLTEEEAKTVLEYFRTLKSQEVPK